MLEVTECERNRKGYIYIKKKQHLRRQQNEDLHCINFLKIVVERKLKSLKRFPRRRNTREKTISIEVTVIVRNLNFEIISYLST